MSERTTEEALRVLRDELNGPLGAYLATVWGFMVWVNIWIRTWPL